MNKKVFLLLAFLCGTLLRAAAYNQDDNSVSSVQVLNNVVLEQSWKAFAPVSFEINGFSLLADSASLLHDMSLRYSAVSDNQLAPMPSDMVNVTGNSMDGYRLLPNGEHFSKPAVITVPFDPFRIPMGYRPSDIYTFYYDEDIAQWKQLERVSVDTMAHTISSYTTHFTDFANAVIKVPEMPESKAYVPTAMTDLPDVNPLQGIPMVAAPTANNRGTTELSYPIEIPAGRLGMQPNLDLHYSSAYSNGILGVGWDLNVSAISVDTRWGVPRYDPRYESEAYLLDGEQLVLHDGSGQALPLPHQISNGHFQTRIYGEVEYFARNTKNQDRVVRYGSFLNNMYWVVTDRNGTKRYYGFDPITHIIPDNAVIRNDGGAIGYWALTAVVDINGNYVHYTYSKFQNEIVLYAVEYTGSVGHNPVAPNYRVRLYYQSRSDINSNGRLGVLQYQSRLLHCIMISTSNNDPPFRHYRMEYENSSASLNKSRLIRIVRVDSPNDCDCGASRKYAPEPMDIAIENDEELTGALKSLSMESQWDEFPGTETLFRYQDALPHNKIFGTQEAVNLTAINKSTNSQWGVGGTATVGFGSNPALTYLSLGGNYSYQRGSSSVRFMIMDIDGDGLVDNVYEESGRIFYRKQNTDGQWEGPKQIAGIHALSREVSSTHCFGFQSSARFGVEYASAGADFSYSPQHTTSYTDVYFTDVNSDGLPDLVTPDGIRINQLHNGIPTFVSMPNSRKIQANNSCCGVVHRDGTVDLDLECHKTWVLDTIVSINSTLIDLGTGNLDRVYRENNKLEEPKYAYTSDSISDPTYPSVDYPISQWGKGEPLYQLDEPIMSIEDGDARVYSQILKPEWYGPDYQITFNDDSLYVYHLETFCSDSSTIPNVDVVRVWVAPYSGNIRMNSSIRLLKDDTDSRIYATKADGVRYGIQHNSTALRPMSIITADDTLSHSSTNYLHVNKHDVLFFRLSANSDRRFDDTKWFQQIIYQDTVGVFNSNLDYVCTENKCFTAPVDGSAMYQYKYTIDSFTAPFVVSVILNGNTVLHRDTFLTARDGLYTGDPIDVHGENTISFELSYLNNEPTWSTIHVFPSVQFAFSASDSVAGSVSDTLIYKPDIEISCSSIIENPEDSLRRLFGKLHRGWGQFAYRDEEHTNIINLSDLSNSEDASFSSLQSDPFLIDNTLSQVDTSAMGNPDSYSAILNTMEQFSPLNSQNKWIPMHANSETEEWEAYGKLGRLGRVLHSTSMPTISTTIDSVYTVEYDSPIPNASSSGNIDFVRKKNTSEQRSISAGVGANVGKVNLGADKNTSSGSSSVDVDFMDMNGDGFPDYVGGRNIQYSHPWGGMGEKSKPSNIGVCQSLNVSEGVGMSGSINVWEKIVSNDIKKQAGFNSSTGGGTSESQTNHSFVDINADGLPDYIDLDHNLVCYNLGYSFSAAYPLDPSFEILRGSSSNFSLGISASYAYNHSSIGGGVNYSQSENNTTHKVVDVDGDGRLDVVLLNNGIMRVLWNVNDNYSAAETLRNGLSLSSITNNESSNLALTLGFTILGIVKVCVGIQGTPLGVSNTSVCEEFMDINADGYVDIVRVSNNGGSVAYNQNGFYPINMLTEVTNPTGQILHFDYALTKPSVEKRTRTWDLVRVTDEISTPGTPNHLTTEISYEKPYYDNFEKTDYGYAKVTSNIHNKKIIVEEYDNTNFISRGEKLGDLLMDTDSIPYVGHRHEVRYMDRKQRPSTSYCDDANLYTARDGYWTDYYDHDTTPSIVMYYTREYDKYYNLTVHSDMGDIKDPDDDWIRRIVYQTTPNSRWRYNSISFPIEEQITDAHGNLLRKSEASYNVYGQPKQIRRWQTDTTFAGTDLYYDVYGNLSFVRMPSTGDSTMCPWRRYLYDAVTNTYPVFCENQFAERYYTGYDLKLGLPTIKIDPIGNPILYRYDKSGRLTEITAPQEWKQHRPATWLYRYAIDAHDLTIIPPERSDILRVGQVASSDGVTDIACCLYDQRGTLLQKKKRMEVRGNEEWVADAVRVYDSFYNFLAQTQPFVSHENVGDLDLDYSQPFSYINKYDVLDRPDTIVNYDGSIRSYAYHCMSDAYGIARLLTQCTDENGVTTSQYKNPQEWVLQETDGNGYSTLFTYNPIGERISAQDADKYRTTYNYDRLGNCVERVHPDAGVTRWTYAPYGNLISKQTAELAQQGLTIDYLYSYDRLEEVRYPNRADKNIQYHYDVAGRVSLRRDGCGSESYTYDELGNVSTSIRRIVVPTESFAYEFRSKHYYDSFGRVRSIVYPDQDSVSYNYSKIGALKSVSHCTGNGSNSPIVRDLIYDEQGRKVSQLYGNDVLSEYTFHPLSQRLTDVVTTIPSNQVIQELHYDYDSVGNIVFLKQIASPYCSLGGNYEGNYVYDNNYRLVAAYDSASTFSYTYKGDYSPAGRQGVNYLNTPMWSKNLSYAYDVMNQTHQPRLVWDDSLWERTSFTWDRNGNLAASISCGLKNGYRFHFWDEDNYLSAVVGSTRAGFYGYDGNGERVWKLTGTCASSQINANQMDCNVWLDKLTLYPNPYMTISTDGYTKQYFNGSEHLATSISYGCSGVFVKEKQKEMDVFESKRAEQVKTYTLDHLSTSILIKGDNEYEDILKKTRYNECFFYEDISIYPNWTTDMLITNVEACGEDEMMFVHSNHLGSASWITNIKGEPIQYIHYAPYGELLANQRAYYYDERYKFTGKERDWESGYDYFSARFLWGDVGTWLSVDPLADKYPWITPYAYCAWNPMKFVDPDGRAVFPNAVQLRSAAEKAMAQYQPDKKGTYCNLGTQMINNAGNGPSFSGTANEMGEKLRDLSFGVRLESMDEVLSYANEGVTVFASWINKEGAHGHIAVVAPSENLVNAGSWGKSVNLFNIGKQNGEISINNVFSSQKKEQVGFYVLKTDLGELSQRTYNGGILDRIDINGVMPALEIKSRTVFDVRPAAIPDVF